MEPDKRCCMRVDGDGCKSPKPPWKRKRTSVRLGKNRGRATKQTPIY